MIFLFILIFPPSSSFFVSLSPQDFQVLYLLAIRQSNLSLFLCVCKPAKASLF